MYKSNNLQSRKMSYSSSYFSSYDDDSNVKLFSIPRTQHIDFDSEHEEENYESFPLNMFLNENSKIYNNFINRKDEKISPLFSSIYYMWVASLFISLHFYLLCLLSYSLCSKKCQRK